ncbi:MAG TPA: hypothetical protein VGC13_04460 [Longimicrobium sp.]|jgi:hypothetical protein|uniref:hypothetical protein n=1 Tax=Longimicrobium sp. TaxID=2029185 RepID=UPI002ED83075
MPEDQNRSIENVEIEPLSEEDLEGVTGGNETGQELVGGTTSSGPSCCSCSDCSR